MSLQFVARTAGLLAASAQTDPATEKINISIRDGVLNYRARKLDDVKAPCGWYEHD